MAFVLTLTDEKRFAMLASLIDLGREANSDEVLNNLAEKHYLDFTERELQFNQNRQEPIWKTNLAHLRSALVEDGFIENSDWRQWRITERGIQYLESLASTIVNYQDRNFQKLTGNAIERALATADRRTNTNQYTVTIILEHALDMLNPNFDYLSPRLTAHYLQKTVVPYIDALTSMQEAINGTKSRNNMDVFETYSQEIVIRSISQNSPLSIVLDGAAQIITIILDFVIPWRREYNRQIAEVTVQDKRADVEIKKYELIEKQASTTRNKAEAEKLLAEALLQRESARKIQLENERSQLDLRQQELRLALNIVESVASNVPISEKMQMAYQLISPIHSIATSELSLRRGQ